MAYREKPFAPLVSLVVIPMKKYSPLFISVSFLLIIFSQNVQSSPSTNPHIPDYLYNTVFAVEPYSDAKLLKIELGSSKDTVLATIGNPLHIEKIDHLNCILFSEESYHLDPLAAKFHGVDSSRVSDHNIPFLAIWFSENGQANHILNNGYIDEIQEKELVGKNRANIIGSFGSPKEEIKIEPCYFLSYSKLKDGPYTGHNQDIFIRRVYFDMNDQVIHVESGQGPMHEIYFGIVGKNKK